MVINSATVSASYSPASVSEVTRTNAQPSVDKAQAAQAQQESTVVKLSAQAQSMSQNEGSESKVQEGSETASIQLREAERTNQAAAQQAPSSASSAMTAYAQVAAQ